MIFYFRTQKNTHFACRKTAIFHTEKQGAWPLRSLLEPVLRIKRRFCRTSRYQGHQRCEYLAQTYPRYNRYTSNISLMWYNRHPLPAASHPPLTARHPPHPLTPVHTAKKRESNLRIRVHYRNECNKLFHLHCTKNNVKWLQKAALKTVKYL